MSYIVQRQDRFYVVAYVGLNPLTGRERRRWHPVGHDRDEAEQLAARLDRDRDATPAPPPGRASTSPTTGSPTSAAKLPRNPRSPAQAVRSR